MTPSGLAGRVGRHRIFSLDEVAVEREGVRVVEGLTYASSAPGWIDIVGANVSGKTTLLRALAGRLPVQTGRILIGGMDLTGDVAARADRIGFAIDAAMLPADLSPRDVYSISARAPCAIDEPALAPLRRALDVEGFLIDAAARFQLAWASASPAGRVPRRTRHRNPGRAVQLARPAHSLRGQERPSRPRRRSGLTLLTALYDVKRLMPYCNRGLLMSASRIAMEMEGDLRAGLADPGAFEAVMVGHLPAAR